MNKHTPGPWEISCSVQVVGASPGNRCIVAQPFTDGTQGPVIGIEAQMANASLIAAAPDLLEALEAIDWDEFEPMDAAKSWGTITLDANQLAAIKAVIAKARGQS